MDYSSISYNKNSDSQYQESEFLWQRTTIEHNSRNRKTLDAMRDCKARVASEMKML